MADDARRVERVVLLDETGAAVGTTPKAQVHHGETPLHLAFSCYVFDADERLLVSRRALTKTTFPGLWTNSVCGHPAPGEDVVEAARRRARDELGLALDDVRLVLPEFRYVATMDGVVENEMCPVFVATVDGTVSPDPAEVEEARWEPWADFRAAVLDGSRDVSAWCREQVAQLPEDPLAASPASAADLPPAARE